MISIAESVSGTVREHFIPMATGESLDNLAKLYGEARKRYVFNIFSEGDRHFRARLLNCVRGTKNNSPK